MALKQQKVKNIPCPKTACEGTLILNGLINKFSMMCKVCKVSWREEAAKNYLRNFREGQGRDIPRQPQPVQPRRQLKIVRETVERADERKTIKTIESTARFTRLKGNNWKYYVKGDAGSVKFGQGKTKSKTKCAELIYQTFGDDWMNQVALAKNLEIIQEDQELNIEPEVVVDNDTRQAQEEPLDQIIFQEYDVLPGGQGSSTNPYPNRRTLAEIYNTSNDPEY
jgi:hypothetical protein